MSKERCTCDRCRKVRHWESATEYDKELDDLLLAYMEKHGNTISQWRNNDYDYAQTLPENDQQEIVPELKQAITNLINKYNREAIKNEFLKCRAEMYRRARFELEAHAQGQIVIPNDIKIAVFEDWCKELKKGIKE
jgi:hypothetical protein